MGLLVLLTVNAVQNFELVWMRVLCKIINSTFVAARVLGVAPGRSRTVRLVAADRPGLWRGPSGPLARTVRTLAEHYSSIPFYSGDWY